ncbi:hypothetical Protein YC6258_04607 [Gynuella sunshinyii YC6258]|uniref:Uncharacterized protein n=1 Tax=Gynuella sunshinyii YC6258 TaxID=1445510 RepID=A0A0C5W1T4_9GAMM|nr:hypothetical Protein YC6258_04607 [Gynuella sunshinyii YC6258]
MYLRILMQPFLPLAGMKKLYLLGGYFPLVWRVSFDLIVVIPQLYF